MTYRAYWEARITAMPDAELARLILNSSMSEEWAGMMCRWCEARSGGACPGAAHETVDDDCPNDVEFLRAQMVR